jgi:predicted NBD/HSP70 family sugar kinase
LNGHRTIRVHLPDTAADLRIRNTALLLDLVWSDGEVSRADLARRSGLARSTVSSILNPLLDADVLRVVRIGRSSGGRPPEVLRLSEGRFHLVGAEIGANHLSVLVTDLRGRVKAWRAAEHPVETDPAGAMALLHRFVVQAVESAAVDPHSVLGLGVAVPCPVHPDDPDRLSPQILPRWRHVRLREALVAAHGWPVFVDNDANMGAVGERWWGAGRDCPSFAFLKVATGVGAGLVIEGRVYRGPGGIAGEIGHTAIDARGPRCRCGLHGCLETLVGSQSLERRAREALAGDPDPALGDAPRLTALVAAAQAGHPLALGLIQQAGEHLGVAIANLVNLVNPTRVVLGGRLSEAGELLLEPLRKALRERAMWSSVLEVEVLVSTLGEQAIARGAATRVLQAALAEPHAYFLRESIPASGQVPAPRASRA